MRVSKKVFVILSIILIAASLTPSVSFARHRRGHEKIYYIAFKMKQAALLPFADNTHKESFYKALAWNGNAILASQLKRKLEESGIELSDMQTVDRILVGRGFIKQMLDINKLGTAQWEMARVEHSEKIDKKLADKAFEEGGAAKGITPDTVIWLGKRLKVQAVIRGSVTELGARRKIEGAFPGKILFPFQGEEGNIIGYADSKLYMAGLEKERPNPFGHITNVSIPRDDRSVFRVTMYLQNASDASILWKGSVDVDCNYKTGEGIEEAADALAEAMLKRFIYYNDMFLYIDSRVE